MTRPAPEPGSWGARLREAREARGWRQKDLADEVDVVYETVSAWELGQSEPLPQNLTALEKIGGTFADLAEERRRAGVGDGTFARLERLIVDEAAKQRARIDLLFRALGHEPPPDE